MLVATLWACRPFAHRRAGPPARPAGRRHPGADVPAPRRRVGRPGGPCCPTAARGRTSPTSLVAGRDPHAAERRRDRRGRVRARWPGLPGRRPGRRPRPPAGPAGAHGPGRARVRLGRRPGRPGGLARDRPAAAGRCSGPSPRAEAVEAAAAGAGPCRRRPRVGRVAADARPARPRVGAADEERRRIERDLHDGAQQRLVALGVELGAAKREGRRATRRRAAALDHAHREVKETLAELRDLVRGIHPAVLTDRGLDAALSALAARSPVPVRVDVPDAAVAEPREHVRAGRRVLRRRRGPHQRRQARDARARCVVTVDRRRRPAAPRDRRRRPRGSAPRRPAAGSTGCAAASPPWTARSTWTARPEPAPDSTVEVPCAS